MNAGANDPAPRSAWLFLLVGLVVASQSGNLVRLGDAPAVVIAAWRLTLAALLLAPLAGRRLARLGDLTAGQRGLLVLAGLGLAAHLLTWILAVQHTTVANAATFFAINPVLTAAAEWLVFRERPSRRLLLSIALGFAGVLAISWPALALVWSESAAAGSLGSTHGGAASAVVAAGLAQAGRAHWSGDLWAVACAALFALYFLAGKRVCAVLPTETYVVGVYGVAAAACMLAVLVLGLPLVDYTPRTWLCFSLLALGPTMIGHTSLNHALRWLSAGTLATATLIEPPLASVVALVAWGEPLTPNLGLGYLLVAASVVVLVAGQGAGRRPR